MPWVWLEIGDFEDFAKAREIDDLLPSLDPVKKTLLSGIRPLAVASALRQSLRDMEGVKFPEQQPEGSSILGRLLADLGGAHDFAAGTAGLEEGAAEAAVDTLVGGVVVEDVAPESMVLEIAAHGYLLVPLQDRFRNVDGLTWREVSTNLEKATKELADFTAESGIRRIGILDSFYLSEYQARTILPDGHAPVFLVDGFKDGQTATLFTASVATKILELQEQGRIPADGPFLLRLKKDELGQTRLSLYL